MQKKTPRFCKSAFTLLELIMVILVVGILLAILTMPLTKVRRQAMLAKCAANMRALHGGVIAYGIDNDMLKPQYPYREEGGFIDTFFAGTTTKMDGKPVAMGKVVEYLGTFEPLLCPAVTVKGDTDTDREMWHNASRAGSSYLYEWFHPPETPEIFSPYPRAFDEWLASLTLTNGDGSDALLLDFNFENIPSVREAYLSHKYLERVNVLHVDGAAIGYGWDEGLYGYQWEKPEVIDILDNAHNLRRASP